MEFATKKDIIERYTKSRKVFTDESEVEDILNSILSFTIKKINNNFFDKNYAYKLDSLGYIYEKDFDIKDLLVNPDTREYKKAENMMHELVLKTNRNLIKTNKEYDLKNSFRHRI